MNYKYKFDLTNRKILEEEESKNSLVNLELKVFLLD